MIKAEESDIEGEEGLYEHHRFLAPAGLNPVRIDKYIQIKLEGISRNKIQNGIRAGAVKVDGESIKPNHKVKPGQTITILLPKPPDLGETIIPENIPLDIRYEDDDVMVIYKPPGLVVHPGIGNYSGTLVNALAWHMQHNVLPILAGNSADRPGLVHRIDKDTSGLMVIAKNDYAMTHLAKQFFDHTIIREYNAIVWGAPEPPQGVIEGNLGRDPRNRHLMTVFVEGEEGKEAITHYETLEDMYYISLVKCVLETGRTHQIRVHMKYLGHPIFNDERYGGDRIVKGTVFTKYKQFVDNCFTLCPRQALHARSIGFEHPTSGEKLYFNSELPDDMRNLLDKWRAYVAHRKEMPGA
ncbi:MAG TPA: RluA family pseudouridine synthase [Saprospiraceae bacterium]|nr:RluA family pseudouridine synthase [Saprospiraceae bacterium]